MLDHFLGLATSDQVLVLVYLAVMSVLSLYAVERSLLAHSARRARWPSTRPALPPDLPMVTVQLPIYNERFVVERLIASAAALDWPHHRLEIQVLDDSTDGTVAIVSRVVQELRNRGVVIEHVRRPLRSGFKAGALDHGMRIARGELLAIFDADFVPSPSFLREVVGHFCEPKVALVQARWDHLNRDASLLTRLQAVLLDGHFLVDHVGRSARGQFFNFNGTAGVWRRSALEDAGGWQDDTLTEDLDISYRAQLRGWRLVYRPDVVAAAELPANMNAYKGQQHRWAKGSAQTAMKLVPRVLRSSLDWRTKLGAVAHLTANFTYPLVLALVLLFWPVVQLRYRAGWTQTLLLDLPLLLLGTLTVVAFYRPALHALTRSERIRLVPALLALGVGMSVNNTRAVIAGVWRRGGEFRRTPKTGRGDRSGSYRPGITGWLLVELALGILCSALAVKSVDQGLLLSTPFLLLFAVGFLGTALASLRCYFAAGQASDQDEGVPELSVESIAPIMPPA